MADRYVARAVRWLDAAGWYGVVGFNERGEHVAHRGATGEVRRFSSAEAALRAVSGRAPWGWCVGLPSFCSVAYPYRPEVPICHGGAGSLGWGAA